MRVAIFDFDGTLYSKETYSLLMEHLKNHPIYSNRYKKFMRNILPPYIATKMKVFPKAKMRSLSMQLYLDALKGLTVKEVDRYFEDISRKMTNDFNDAVIARMHEHASNGIHIMIVSGAYTPLLHLVTKDLPVDTIIGTDVHLHNGNVTDKTLVNHIQGQGKNKAIEKALANEEIDWENSFAYGDSFSDVSVLQLVGNPVAVNPEPKLHKFSEKHRWTIL